MATRKGSVSNFCDKVFVGFEALLGSFLYFNTFSLFHPHCRLYITVCGYFLFRVTLAEGFYIQNNRFFTAGMWLLLARCLLSIRDFIFRESDFTSVMWLRYCTMLPMPRNFYSSQADLPLLSGSISARRFLRQGTSNFWQIGFYHADVPVFLFPLFLGINILLLNVSRATRPFKVLEVASLYCNRLRSWHTIKCSPSVKS